MKESQQATHTGTEGTVPSTVRVAVFGPLTDLFETGALQLELRFPTTAEELRSQLGRSLPELADRRFQIAVDERIVRGGDVVEAAREIALLPPFAGG
jgi:molybdopterin converting factor small subunit